MIVLHEKQAATGTPPEQTARDRQIAPSDARISCLVYDIYGLTENKIKIVERATP